MSGFVKVVLSKPPVNSLDGEFLTNIADLMKTVDKDDSVNGVILTSQFNGKVFSAGLNILDMVNRYVM